MHPCQTSGTSGNNRLVLSFRAVSYHSSRHRWPAVVLGSDSVSHTLLLIQSEKGALIVTLSELLDVGRACLMRYEPRLKVKGKKPYSESAKALSALCKCSLSTATRGAMEVVIEGILDELLE